jgi:activator of HSP90 ATPase
VAYDFELSCTIPATPEAIHEAWLNSAAHSEMTGGEAVASNKLGAPHSAWDGYITGKNVELVPGVRIVQTWRTSEFAADDPDSTITVALTPVKTGTKLTLTHRGVPDGQTSYEEEGWREYYFEPMKAYFSARRTATRSKAGTRKREG